MDTILILSFYDKVLKPAELLSTSPAWGTTPEAMPVAQYAPISIHVPRVGDDTKPRMHLCNLVNVSIHVPRVGDDV